MKNAGRKSFLLPWGVCIVLAIGLIGCATASSVPAIQLWSESWRVQIFKDTTKPEPSTAAIGLVTAKNDYEAAQIALRCEEAFTVRQISFSPLTDGTHVIPADNLSSNFVGYITLPKNGEGRDATNYIRKAPGDFPEYLLNDSRMEVAANTTQPLWVTAYIPPDAAAGLYSGTVTIATSLGELAVPLTVEVCEVTIPPAHSGAFTCEFWSQLYRQWEVTDPNMRNKDILQAQYGVASGSSDYWVLMEQFAQLMQKNRFNSLMVPLNDLLIDGGTTMDAAGSYTFNFSRFDQFCSFFIQRGAVKWLAGAPLCQGNTLPEGYAVEYLAQDAHGLYRSFGSLHSPVDKIRAENYLKQLVPQLKAHLEQKGWAGLWRWHVGDEPKSDKKLATYKAVATLLRQHWPDAIIGDAIPPRGIPVLSGLVDTWTAELSHYQSHQAAYDARTAAGEGVWGYTCMSPTEGYLNRFIDQQVYKAELIGWFANLNRLPGYLHWGLMEQGVWPNGDTHAQNNPGDSWSIYPDAKNRKIISTIRIDAAREMSEDYELLEILRRRQGDGAANAIIRRVLSSATSYSDDVALLLGTRNELVRSAGQPQ